MSGKISQLNDQKRKAILMQQSDSARPESAVSQGGGKKKKKGKNVQPSDQEYEKMEKDFNENANKNLEKLKSDWEQEKQFASGWRPPSLCWEHFGAIKKNKES